VADSYIIESAPSLDDGPIPDIDIEDFYLTQRLDQLFHQAATEKRKLTANWKRNYALVSNQAAAMALQSPWSPNVTDSEIFPIMSSRIAWMTDQKISPEVAPAALIGDPYADHLQKLAEHMEVLLNSSFQVQGWDRQITLMLWDAGQFGAGILKSIWDSGLDGGLGNVALKRCDVWGIYPDPNATDTDDMSYLFEVKRMTYEEIQRRFPSADHERVKAAVLYGERGNESQGRPTPTASSQYPMAMPGNLPGSSGSTWGLPGQSNRSSNEILSEGILVKECWVRENAVTYEVPTDPVHGDDPVRVVHDQWRCVIYTGNVVLFDELAIDLWEHDRHPYSRFVDEETGEFWPTPIVSHLAPCQTAINRILSSMQGNVELVGNPIFMDVKTSGLERTQIVNRPGLRLSMSSQVANSQGAKPQWLEPPKFSGDALQLLGIWKTAMENISGLSGVTKGNTPQGRQAQQTVQASQEAGFVRIRSALRNLERTLAEQFTLLAHLVIQNYDIPRTVAIVGQDGENSALLLSARHFYSPTEGGDVEARLSKLGFSDGKSLNMLAGLDIPQAPMKFSLVVIAGASNPTSRQARIAESDALFQMKAIDRPAVLQAHAYPHWQQIDDRMNKAEAAMAAALAQGGGGKGQPKGPGTGHAH
jgi:hypothetical protein